MALIMKTQEPVTSGPAKGFSWDAWYAKNKSRLSEKRARRYREDTAYREAALERSRKQRETKKVTVKDDNWVSFNDAAVGLGITVWVLREWRRKDYFPEPARRQGRLWFTPPQVQLLQRLHEFFVAHGVRVTEANRQALEEVVSLIYANWS